eukprot:gene58195-biopygen10827
MPFNANAMPVVVPVVRWLLPELPPVPVYDIIAPSGMQQCYSGRRVLLVGEGDFTFAAELAKIIGYSQIVATDKKKSDQVLVTRNARTACQTLHANGARVGFGVDATLMPDSLPFGFASGGFDIVRWNHPHSEMFGTDASKRCKDLVLRFVRSARRVLRPGGQVHFVCAKTRQFLKPQPADILPLVNVHSAIDKQQPWGEYIPRKTTGKPLADVQYKRSPNRTELDSPL